MYRTASVPAEFSPQVPAQNTPAGQNGGDSDSGMPDYSLDQVHQPQYNSNNNNNSQQMPLSLDTFNINDDSILTSAGPFQQNFTFSPTGSPMVANGGFSAFNSNSIASSLNSAADYYSPPQSGYPSAVSHSSTSI